MRSPQWLQGRLASWALPLRQPSCYPSLVSASRPASASCDCHFVPHISNHVCCHRRLLRARPCGCRPQGRCPPGPARCRQARCAPEPGRQGGHLLWLRGTAPAEREGEPGRPRHVWGHLDRAACSHALRPPAAAWHAARADGPGCALTCPMAAAGCWLSRGCHHGQEVRCVPLPRAAGAMGRCGVPRLRHGASGGAQPPPRRQRQRAAAPAPASAAAPRAAIWPRYQPRSSPCFYSPADLQWAT